MADITVSVDELAASIMNALETYADAVTEDVKQDVRDTAAVCKKEIVQNISRVQAAAPKEGSGYTPRTWKNYRRGWTVTVKETPSALHATIHNKSHYRLTHLLENSHLVVRSGRVYGRTRAFPHIKPAEENATAALAKKIEMSVKK